MAVAVSRGTLLCKSEPFAYALSSNSRGSRCDYCLQNNENLHRCNQCQFSYYCDKKCQKSAWKDHKHECTNIKKVHPRQPTDFVLLISRVIYKLKLQTDRGEKIGNVIRYFKDLESHSEEIKKDSQRLYELSVFCSVLNDFLPPDVLPPYLELLEIFGKIIINCYTISDEELGSIGVGLYLGASIFDHSCKPNATLTFEGPTIFVYTTEPIPSLDYSKIYLSYTDLLSTRAERRKFLQDAYYFTCVCDKCQNDDYDRELSSFKCVTPNCDNPVILKDGSTICSSCGLVPMSKEILESSTRAMELCVNSFQEIQKLKKSKQFEAVLERTENILKSATLFLHPSNLHFVRIVDLALDACVEVENIFRAAELTDIVLPTYRKLYGSYHPALGIQLLKRGKLAMNTNNLISAKEKFIEAGRIINTTHSQSHPLRATCFECMAQLNAIKPK